MWFILSETSFFISAQLTWLIFMQNRRDNAFCEFRDATLWGIQLQWPGGSRLTHSSARIRRLHTGDCYRNLCSLFTYISRIKSLFSGGIQETFTPYLYCSLLTIKDFPFLGTLYEIETWKTLVLNVWCFHYDPRWVWQRAGWKWKYMHWELERSLLWWNEKLH